MDNKTWLVKIQLERIQTYLFEVPELKMMIGANALVGEVLRGRLEKNAGDFEFTSCVGVEPHCEETDNLPALARKNGASFPDAAVLAQLNLPTHESGEIADPLEKDFDNPFEAYRLGILIRDAGNLHAVFPSRQQADMFLTDARRLFHSRLPGLRYTANLARLAKGTGGWTQETINSEISDQLGESCALPEGPQLQICQATGQGVAHQQEWRPENELRYVSDEAHRKRLKGRQFDKDDSERGTSDILGLMRDGLLAKLREAANGDVMFSDEFRFVAPSGKLAVVVADGNGIGNRSRAIKEACGSADLFQRYAAGECFFHRMRRVVRRALVDALVETFGPVLNKTSPRTAAEPKVLHGKKVIPFRLLMLGGDDLLLVCDAPHALPFLRAYVRQLQKYGLEQTNGQPVPLQIGAGVAIVKSVFPFHRAHELAEELAKSAKRLARECPSAGSTVDWLSSTESWHADVTHVRRRDALRSYQLENGRAEHLVLSRKPYPIQSVSPHDAANSLSELLDAADAIVESDKKLARTQLKGLAEAISLGKRRAELAVQAMPHPWSIHLVKQKIFQLGFETPFATPWLGSDQPGWYSTSFLDFLEIHELRHRQAASSEESAEETT